MRTNNKSGRKKSKILASWAAIIVLAVIFSLFAIAITITITQFDNNDFTLTNVTSEGNFTRLWVDNLTAPYDSLVGYWSFDGDKVNTATTKHYDYSSYNQDGTGVANTVANSTCGLYGNGACMDGNGDYVSIPTSAVLNSISNNLTISMWAKSNLNYTDLNAVQDFWYLYATSTDRIYASIADGTGQISLFNDIDDLGTSENLITIPTWGGNILNWNQYSFVFNDTSIALYLNGVYQASDVLVANLSRLNDGYQITIGGDLTGFPLRDWNGSVDDVMIFNSSLNSTQISAIYQNTSARFVALGMQQFSNQSILGIANGSDKVNVTAGYLSPLTTNISLVLGYYNTSWSYTAPQNLSTSNLFTISTASTNLTLNFTFYPDANKFYTPILNSTITIQTLDTIAPTLSIILPVNNSNFNTNVSIALNYTASDFNSTTLSACWYSLNSGATNSTTQTCGTNWTINVSQGYSNITVYANDTSNNLGSNLTFIFADSVNSTLSWISPSPDAGQGRSANVTLNVSVSDVTSANTYAFFNDGLVGWWTMDNTNSSGDPTDISGRGNNGSKIGGAVQTGAGKFGKGFLFDGVNDWVRVNNMNSTTTPTKNVTIALWAYPYNTTTYNYVYGHPGTFAGSRLYIGKYLGKWGIAAGNVVITTNTTSSVLSQWTFLAGVWNGSLATLYLNGAQVVNIVYSANASTSTYDSIGQSGEYYFNGTIDDVLVFNRSLSASEISALYNSSQYSLQRSLTNLSEGAQSYTAYAVDMGGNINFSTRNFIVDLTYPQINFTSPTLGNNNYTNSSTIAVNVSVSDANNVSTFIDFDNSLVSWWRMDELNGSSDPVDYMSRNNGSKQGNAAQTMAGKFGKGFVFDGNGDYVSVPYNAALKVEDNFTISAWVNLASTTSNAGILYYGSANAGTQKYGLFRNSATSQIVFSVITSNSTTNRTSNTGITTLTLNQWTLITGVYNRSSSNGHRLKLYVNGVNVSNGTGYDEGIAWANSALQIGAHSTNGGSWNGTIDDVMIFNRSLSSTEISALYNNRSSYYLDTSFSGLANGNHTFKAYTQDEAGNVNSTELRTLIVDTGNPNATLLTPLNNTYTSNVTQNLTGNLTDNLGIKNATLYVYNQNNRWLSFDGNGDYVNVPNKILPSEFNLTISAWVKGNAWSATGNGNIIFSEYFGAGGSRNELYIDSGGDLNFDSYPPSGNQCSETTANFVVGTWYHVVATVNSTNRTLYINGAQRKVCSNETYTGTTPTSTQIGAWSNVNYYFNGTIDEVRIYNRSLSSSEISQIYSSGMRRNPSLDSTGLVAWYDFQNSDGNATRLADVGTGLNNGTIVNAVWSSLESTSVFSYALGVVQAVAGAVVTLIEGIYNWFYSVFDWAGNVFTSQNYTITVDTTKPLINFTSPTPSNGSGRTIEFLVNVSITETNLANVTYNWNGTVRTENTSSSNFTNLGSGNWVYTVNQTLTTGVRYTYNITAIDLAGNSNSTETRTILGNTAPTYVSVNNTPSTLANLDPGVRVNITANISDSDNNFDSAILQWKNATSSWNNVSMENRTAKGIYTFMNSSFTLPAYEANITYRIWANDTEASADYSSNYTIQSWWDCTWNSTSDFGAIAGYNQNKNIGGIIVNNTGDIAYTNTNCTLQFRVSYDLSEGRMYYDSEYVKNLGSYTITAGGNTSITINATFGSEIKQESATVTLDEFRVRSETRYRNTTATLVTTQAGPYLYQKITTYPSSVNLTSGNFSLNAYLRNLVGSDNYNASNTAFNVSFNWTLPSGLTNLSGNLSNEYGNLSESGNNYIPATIGFTNLQSFSPGVKIIYLYSGGVNVSGGAIKDANNQTLITDTASVTFLCYNVSDGLCVTSCGNAQDSDCAPETVTTTVSSGSSGGGGGGGAAGKSEKSEATFELLRGKEQSFSLEIRNKYSGTLNNLKLSVSGINAEYIEINPDTVDRIGGKQAVNVNVVISAPAYFSGSKYTLIFSVSGDLVIEGMKSAYTEKKRVTLYIVEVDRTEADKLLEEIDAMISEMNKTGMQIKQVVALAQKARESYEAIEFSDVKDMHESANSLYESALESQKIFDELSVKIKKAENDGLSVIETKKMIYVAETAFKRGDFKIALERLKEAKLTYALEVKGEFNFMRTIKNNPLESFGILIGTGLFGFGSSILIRRRIYKSKIKLLKEEEKILLELMKVIQRECFENNRMSMNEYEEAMGQYESKLSSSIEERISIESKLANLLKRRGRKKALFEEKSRLIEMIKEIQDKYLNKGQIETRIYENMIRSYSTKLSGVEEQITFLDAQEALGKNKSKGRKNER